MGCHTNVRGSYYNNMTRLQRVRVHLMLEEVLTRTFRSYLTEISPVAFRASFPGIAYQLGNMVSSASAQIEATAGQNIKTAAGTPDYGTVSTILIGTVAGAIILLNLVGPEVHSSDFTAGKSAVEDGAGNDVLDADHADFSESGSIEKNKEEKKEYTV